MSWHFSQALEEAYLAANSLIGEQFAPWKSIPIAQDDSCSAKMKGTFHRSPYGIMFVPLTENRGKELLMWFQEVSRAKTYPKQTRMLTALMAHEAAFGERCRESLAKYDRDTHSLRTRQCLLFEDSTECLETLPRWGIMLAGELYPQETRALPTLDSELGSWPTPRASVIAATASMETIGHIKNPRGNLEEVVFARTYPTPTAHMAKECNAPSEAKRNEPTLTSQVVGGKTTQPTYLNPDWVEWLMGWPIGWTDLKPLGMDKFRTAWLLPGLRYVEELSNDLLPKK